MKEDWIEARVEDRFTALSGAKMVSFDVKRPDGRNWAVPLKLVEKQLGAGFSPGMAVLIQIDGDRIRSVQRAGGQMTSSGGRLTPSLDKGSSPGAKSGISTTDTQAKQPTVLPYGFVSIDPAKAVTDTPVWHDGEEGGELYSGEFRCALEALTPLLPGNARYQCHKCQTALKSFQGRAPKSFQLIGKVMEWECSFCVA